MNKQKIINVVAPVFALVAIALSAYFYYQWNLLRQNPNAVAQKEVKDLVVKVSKLMVLPEEEIPTVATVSDVEKLKDQAFFTKAQAGDKVLIYTTAKKAVLYSPTLNKIIEVAPLNIGQPSKQTPAPSTTEKES